VSGPRTGPAAAAVASEPPGALPPPQRDTSTTKRRTAIIALAAVYITWGSTYLGIAYAIRTIPIFLMGAMRFALAGLVFVGIALARGDPRPTRQELRSAAIAGVLLLAISNAAVIWAETRVASGTTSLLVTTPLWLVLMEWMRGRRPTRGVLVGLALGAIGIAILVGPGELAGTGQVDRVAAGVLLLSSMVWAIGSLYTRYAPLPQSPLMATGLEMVSGSAVLFVVATGTGEVGHFTFAHVSTVSWLGFGYLIVFGSWVGFTSYIWLMRNVPIEHAATYAFVNPVIAVILGWAVAGEPFFARTAVAAVFIVAAVASITLRDARPLKRPRE
jgi:drug/metabolite transporter (DMT)-like permease